MSDRHGYRRVRVDPGPGDDPRLPRDPSPVPQYVPPHAITPERQAQRIRDLEAENAELRRALDAERHRGDAYREALISGVAERMDLND